MKSKTLFFVFFSSFCASAIEIVSYIWRKGDFIDPRLQEKYYVGALLMAVFGGLELLSLYALRNEVRQMKGKRKQHWNNIVQFVFLVNCIGLPIYITAFLLNRLLT